MSRELLRFLSALLCAAVLGGAFDSAPAQAAGRDRALERALGTAYDDAETAQVARAFRAAAQGGVREGMALDLVEACVDGGLDAEQVVRILSLATQLALEELPVEGFVDKVKEGAAKGAAPERVVRAAESRALRLNQARGIVNAAVLDGLAVDDRDELIVDVAGALEEGRPVEEVRDVLRSAQEEGRGTRRIRRELFP